MKNLLLASTFMILCNIPSFAQQWQSGGGNMKEMGEKMKAGRIYGKVIDSTTNKAVEFASVQLIGSVWDTVTKSMKKDVVVAGQLTLENGDFSLDKINVMGKFRLKISAMGYVVKESPFSFNLDPEKMKGGGMGMLNAVDKDLGNLKIKQNITVLKGVEITSETPVFELKPDKKVFNVDKSLASTGGTAEDVLKKVPSVSVDMDGNVTMRNAPPQIFVDGKPTTLSLDQIPSDAIESVELITNPSAKYDASGGQGGILNIVLKKEKRVGYNGNIRTGADQRGKANLSGDINMRGGKINAFISASVRQSYNITRGTTDRENIIGSPLTNIGQTNYSLFDGVFSHNRGGIDWFIDNRNTITFSGNYILGDFGTINDLATRTDTVDAGTSAYTRKSEAFRKFQNVGGSVQYKRLFPKPGRELTGDMNFNRVEYNTEGQYNSIYYSASGVAGPEIAQTMAGSGSNQILSGQADFKNPLDSSSRFEAGIKGSSRDFGSNTKNYLQDSTGEFNLIRNQSSNYSYIDNILAAYIIYGKQIKKFSYQAGLRSESSFYTGELVDSNKTFKTYYPASLFPSFSASYEKSKRSNYQISYSRRINRPSFFQVIPYTDYSDSLNLTKGNASLKPEFTHSMELSWLNMIGKKNSSVLSSVYFKNSTDLITSFQMIEYDSTLGKTAVISSYENANGSYIYGGELTGKVSFGKWVDLTVNLNAYYSVLNAKNLGSKLSSERFSWFTKENITIRLPKNISMELTPEYYSKVTVPLNNNEKKWGGWGSGALATAQGYTKEHYRMDAAIRYEFMKNRAASITVNISDVFGTEETVTVSNSDYFNQTAVRYREKQFFRFNFSCRFGKFDATLFKRKNTKVNMDGMDVM